MPGSKGRGRLAVLAVGLVGAGLLAGAGVRYLKPRPSPDRPAGEHAALRPPEPAPDHTPELPTSPLVPNNATEVKLAVVAPAVLPEGVNKERRGDRIDLAAARLTGPPVRTGGRPGVWTYREILHRLPAGKARRVAFAADGSRAAVCTADQAVFLYGLRDRKAPVVATLADLTGNLTDGGAPLAAVCLSPDGGRVLLTTVGRSEKPLDGNALTTRYNLLVGWEAGREPELLYGPRLEGSQPGLLCLAVGPDGKDVLAGGTPPHVYRWALAGRDRRPSRRWFKHGDGDRVNAVAFAPDGRYALSAGLDRAVCVYDATRPEGTPVAVLKGHHGYVLCAAFGAENRYAVSGGRDGQALVWRVGDDPEAIPPAPAQRLDWHGGAAVVSVACSPAGDHFLTGGADGSVCLGRVGRGEPVWKERLGEGGAVLALGFSADGAYALAADDKALSRLPVRRESEAAARGPGSGDGTSPEPASAAKARHANGAAP